MLTSPGEEGSSDSDDEDIIEDLRHLRLENMVSDPDRDSLLLRLGDASKAAQRSAVRRETPFIVNINTRTFFPVSTREGEVRLQGTIAIPPERFSEPGVYRARTDRGIRTKIKKVRELEFLSRFPGDKIYRLVLVPLRFFRRTIKAVVSARDTLKNIAVLYFPCKEIEEIDKSCVVYH